MDKDALLQAAREGDDKALTALLGVCQPDLRRYAQRRCASKDVDDAVQEALWIVHERFRALRYAAALSGWLFKVVQRICLRMGLRERNLTSLDEEIATIDLRSSSIDLRLDLHRALAELEQSQLEVLLLRDLHGYSAEEVAARLHISSEAVKSRLHRARIKVRDSLGEGNGTP